MSEKIISLNRKAKKDYSILETHEAGVVLSGTEVKSLRAGRTNLSDSFAQVEKGEVFIYKWHISPYDFGNRYNLEPKRPRKLLLHRTEIKRLYGKVAERGFALIPLKLYLKKGRVKLELALAKGKHAYDKREDLKRKEMEREMEVAFKGYGKK
ncbi:MAG: SsrA-binding protein SmpB [bacterium]|nr:SsrA-binding protein SmpB [bacterium]